MKKEKISSYAITITATLVLVLIFGISLTQGTTEERTKNNEQIAGLENRINALESTVSGLQENNKNSQTKIKSLLSKVEKLNQSLALSQQKNQSPNSLQSIISAPKLSTVSQKEIKPKVSTKKVINYSYLEIAGFANYKLPYETSVNALKQLTLASEKYNFAIKTTSYDFGTFVDCIGGVCGDSSHFWSLYKNGEPSQVGASDLWVSKNDKISWVYTSF